MGAILLLCYISIVSGYFSVRGKSNCKAELNLLFLGLFVFIAFRAPSVGTDTSGYVKNYVSQSEKSLRDFYFDLSSGEVGYHIFIFLLYKILPFKQGLLLTQGLIVTVCYRAFVKRFCGKSYFYAVLAFMTFGLLSFHLTGIRQSIAMSICCLVYIAFVDKKYLLAFLLNALAFFFHYSAIVFLMAFLFSEVWKKYNNLFTTAILAVLFAALSERSLQFFADLIERWEMYRSVEITGNGGVFFAVLICVAVLAEICLRYFNKEERKHVRVNYLTVIFWAGRMVTRTFERPCLYFLPSTMAVLSNSLTSIRGGEENSTRKITAIFATVLIAALYVYRNIGFTYSFFWM